MFSQFLLLSRYVASLVQLDSSSNSSAGVWWHSWPVLRSHWITESWRSVSRNKLFIHGWLRWSGILQCGNVPSSFGVKGVWLQSVSYFPFNSEDSKDTNHSHHTRALHIAPFPHSLTPSHFPCFWCHQRHSSLHTSHFMHHASHVTYCTSTILVTQHSTLINAPHAN